MDSVLINVQQGMLRGKTGTDYAGRSFYCFQGIPYAKPPLGELRFKDPQPPESWAGVRDATKEGTVSYQSTLQTREVRGGEDCLFLNVYTPEINKSNNTALHPVMFYIHGGGFFAGSGNTEDLGPEYLLARDIVFVTINYRLGILGFLKLEDPSLEIPGNAGLKDIVLALRWVKDNIKNFSGDPCNITIFGNSTGSSAVHYLIYSPLAKGLFHKAIMQSGTALCQWAKGYYKKEQYIKVLGLKTNDERDILQTLSALPIEKLFKVQESLGDAPLQCLRRPYGPEPELPSNNAFLPFNPEMACNINAVPILIGYTNWEGIFNVLYSELEKTEPIHKDFEKFVPHGFNLQVGSMESKEIAQKIKEFYYKDSEPSSETLETFIKLESDVFYVHCIQKVIQQMMKYSNKSIFMYRFCFDGKIYFFKRRLKIPIEGAGHTDELSYLFTQSPRHSKVKLDKHIDAMIKKMTKIWTNFARFGNPNPQNNEDERLNIDWKPVTKDEMNYVNIDEQLSSGINPEAERVAFWDSLYDCYPDAKYWL